MLILYNLQYLESLHNEQFNPAWEQLTYEFDMFSNAVYFRTVVNRLVDSENNFQDQYIYI